MKIRSIAVALCAVLVSTPVYAKTFIGVLWPMFGPLPAIGLVELVGEIKMMPDVEVKTYLHQEWPQLVEDLARQPKGTRTAVIGYSLGANASVFVANKSKYIDLIIALQPSMLSWNPSVTGKVGRMIEVYNPNPWMTFGGMGSKKLIGDNIQYVANNDSHPGAQFSFQFRDLVKSEITKLSTEPTIETAQADLPKQPEIKQPEIKLPEPARQPKPAEPLKQVALAQPPKQPEPTKQQPKLDTLAANSLAAKPPKYPRKEVLAFLDSLSSSVDSGRLPVDDSASQPAGRQLTAADMMDYAKRMYRGSHEVADGRGDRLNAGDIAITGSIDAGRNSKSDKLQQRLDGTNTSFRESSLGTELN